MNVLFICTANRERSRTAEIHLQNKYPENRYRSAGINKYLSERHGGIHLQRYMIERADTIVCFESEHAHYIYNTYGDGIVAGKNFYVLNIGDVGNFMTPELIYSIERAVDGKLHITESVKYNSPLKKAIDSCTTCHYSGNGQHSCNRLMDYVRPKIDVSKGVECAHNGYVHYLNHKAIKGE
jgi:predicted protein tyrosine phosphatase